MSSIGKNISTDFLSAILDPKDEISYEGISYNPTIFEKAALEVLLYQAENNPIYKKYLYHLGISVDNVQKVIDIPFMPIRFFKDHSIISGHWQNQGLLFESSGTTGQIRSKHWVQDPEIYKQTFLRLFEDRFGPIENIHLVCVLPSYAEREHSSLLYMAENLVKKTCSKLSGFFLYEEEALIKRLEECKQDSKRQTLLLGVSFALIELCEQHDLDLSHVIILETGGMKGRRADISRPEMYEILHRKLRPRQIVSEYGMTELLSQTYTQEEGKFVFKKTLRAYLRNLNDPRDVGDHIQRGAINLIDLANVYSCSFLATDDLGVRIGPQALEILGRIDHSDLRGCNFLL